MMSTEYPIWHCHCQIACAVVAISMQDTPRLRFFIATGLRIREKIHWPFKGCGKRHIIWELDVIIP